uniref:Uncharacterized protein n=1 Tax=Cucumis sativus TaxID=3659 RepID=A0A0A0KC28_CUCSA
MAKATYHIASLSLHMIWLLFLSKPCTALEPKITRSFLSILIFGDSTVDTGNNNFISTIFKANYSPYGTDFPGHILNCGQRCENRVGFASAGSGFDELTASVSNVISVMKQIDMFKNYTRRLQGIVGVDESRKILNSALVVISAGTNDVNINFYDLPIRQLQYNISGYQDFVQNRLQSLIKEIYQLGCRTIVVAGLPPVGCLPIQESIAFQKPQDRKCLEEQNSDFKAYNQKLAHLLSNLQPQLPGSTILYGDIYTPLIDMVNNPHNYGFEHVNVGCCGTGMAEAGPLCNSKTSAICENPSKFMFWDSVHPIEAAYNFITESLLKQFVDRLN